MLSWIKGLLFGRSIYSVINETKVIRINGIRFVIKRIDAMSYLDGSKVMLQHYDTFKLNKALSNQEPEISSKKIREHMKDILIAGVVEPKLALKKEDGFLVDDLFVNMKLVNTLYESIVTFTYGKKKILNS